MTGATATLGEFVASLRFGDIPTEIAEKQQLHVLDGIGNGLYGSNTPFGASVLRSCQRGQYGEQASVWGTGILSSAERTAFANAAFANVGELEDAHHRTKFKPNTLLVPAVLALGEWTDATGSDAIAAIIAGTEVGIRIGEALHLGSDAYKRGWLGTGGVGAAATAASAANLLRLNPSQSASAIALGANMPCGIWSSGLTPAKRVMIGHAAASGILAAYLAADGIEVTVDVLGDEWGSLPHILSGVLEADRLTYELGRYWKTGEVGLEWYPTKGALHSSIDGLIELATRHDLHADEVTKIVIRTARSIAENPALGGFPPAAIWEAQHSLKYCLAVTILEKNCTMEQFRPELYSDERIATIADRIFVVSDDEATALYPKTKTAVVEVTLSNGTELSTRVDYCTGEPENFPSVERIIAKFHDAASHIESQDLRDQIVGHCLHLHELDSLRKLTTLLR